MARSSTSFGPGNNANPKGRPRKGTAMADVLRKVLAEKQGDGRTKREVVAQAIIDRAANGDTWAINFIYDRLDGRMPEGDALPDGDGGIRIHTVTAILPPRKQLADGDE